MDETTEIFLDGFTLEEHNKIFYFDNYDKLIFIMKNLENVLSNKDNSNFSEIAPRKLEQALCLVWRLIEDFERNETIYIKKFKDDSKNFFTFEAYTEILGLDLLETLKFTKKTLESVLSDKDSSNFSETISKKLKKTICHLDLRIKDLERNETLYEEK